MSTLPCSEDRSLHAAYVDAARNVRSHSFASLTFLVWETFVTLDDEVQYIWTMRNGSPFKWMYFFLRYVIMLAHVMHNLIFEALVDGNNPSNFCRLWFPYVIVSSQTIQTMLEFILASRVFALYNRSKKIALLLLILVLVEIGGTVRMLWLGNNVGYYGTCILIGVDKNAMKQSILGFIVHCTLVGLTLFKCFFARKAGWGRTPLVSLLVRDNTSVYATIVFLLVSVVVLCGLENERGVAVFFWATALNSISGCRVVLSMERFAREETLTGPLFTSEINIGTQDSGKWRDKPVS